MNRFRNYVLAAAGFVVLLGTVTVFMAPYAIAQIKAALVKNVDEPGRQPYEVEVQFGILGCVSNCANFQSFTGLTLVSSQTTIPLGKRLVVKHVDGLFNALGPGLAVAFQSSPSGNFEKIKWAFFGPVFSVGNYQALSSEAFFTYGPGEALNLWVGTPGFNPGYVQVINISGYLIDATN